MVVVGCLQVAVQGVSNKGCGGLFLTIFSVPNRNSLPQSPQVSDLIMFRAITVIAAAAAVPYVITKAPDLDKLLPGEQESAAEIAVAADGLGQNPPAGRNSPQNLASNHYPSSAPYRRMHSVSLHDVFRFDVSKGWVYHRWSRKSTALAELGLFGIRVPLVTGTQMHDIAGSLTYYFSEGDVLERISFTGHTGDTTQLVMLMTQRYGLQPQPTVVVGEQLFQERYQDHVFSELRIRPAFVVRANSPLDNYAVELELQRPGAPTPLPRRTPPGNLATSEQQADSKSEAASESETKDPETEEVVKKTPEEAWRMYSPRSRVPKEQVQNLDRRDRFW